MSAHHRSLVALLAYLAALFFFVFAAFDWSLSDLTWQNEVAAGLVAASVGWLVSVLP